jgi:hypothetical protein
MTSVLTLWTMSDRTVRTALLGSLKTLNTITPTGINICINMYVYLCIECICIFIVLKLHIHMYVLYVRPC